MTDANGTRNSSNGSNGALNGANGSGANPQTNSQTNSQNAPAAKDAPSRSRRSRIKPGSEPAKSSPNLSSRRSRRELAQRKRGMGSTAKEGRSSAARHNGAKVDLPGDRARSGDAASTRQRLRTRKSTALKLAGGSTSGANSASPSARKKTPPNLSLARRRNVRRKAPVPLLYMGRLAVAGLGIAVIGGTLLKVLPSSDSPVATITEAAVTVAEPAIAPFPMTLGQQIAPLKTALQELPNLYPSLTPKVFYIDVESGDYVDLEGTESVAAASTIKLPVLLAFFDAVDAGSITFNQTVALLPEQIAEGSGDMQFSEPGTQFTALEVASQMIVNSDNTATNVMVDLLGGPARLNDIFVEYGLQKTQLNNPLPDLAGTNTTSAKDLVHTMLLISGDRLTLKSRDRILNILNRTYNKSLLASGMVEKEALTYNKTGDIESVLGDVALVDLANGKRYVVAALVERPSNDNRAVELIHRISGLTYQETEKAIQPALAPPGNDTDGSTDASSEPASDADIESVPVEEPYPSANPEPSSDG